MKSKPLVSAIVSTYNSEVFIKGKIEDLLEQTITDQLEIIIINSGSKQNEDRIIQEYLSHPNIRYIQTEERETIYKAWNRGIQRAKGLFITNANTDDRLKEDALEVLSSVLIQNPEVALVYADQFVTHEPNKTFNEVSRLGKSQLLSFPEFNYFRQLDQCLVCSQPMWRAGVHFEDNIWFEEKYEILGDYDFDLRITQKYKMLHIAKPLGVFYLSPKKENKSLNDPVTVSDERAEISEPFIRNIIQSEKSDELQKIIIEFEKYLRIPLPIFYPWKRLCLFLNPKLIHSKYFYSIEFMYYFAICYLEKENKIDVAIRFSKKFLRYGKSRRIRERLQILLKIKDSQATQ